jgi:hypothetical protein
MNNSKSLNNSSKNWRAVTYDALEAKYGKGSQYRWVSPQTNKGTGHFEYRRDQTVDSPNTSVNPMYLVLTISDL